MVSTLLNSLVAFYPLDHIWNGYAETSYPTSAGAGTMDFLVVGTPSQTADGRPCIAFNAVTDSLQASNLPWSTLVNGFSIACWGKVDFTGSPFIFSNQQTASPYRTVCLGRVVNVLQLEMRTSGSTQTTTATLPSTNTWHHYAVTYNGTTGTLYVDGASVATLTLAAPLFQSTAPLTFGDVYSVPTNGFIGEGRAFGVWARALTAAEVTELYNGGVRNDYPFAALVHLDAVGKKVYTADNTYGQTATNFQQNLLLTYDAFDFTRPKLDGSDLRVYTANGLTARTFFLEYYDPVCAQASLWVLFPSLAAGAPDFIQVGWDGASSSASSYDGACIKLAKDGSTLALYHCDDGTGTTVTDATGTYTGTTHGTVTWGSGDGGNFRNNATRAVFASGSYLIFDGSSGYAQFGSLLDAWPTHGTISFWFRPDAAWPGSVSQANLFSKFNSNFSGGGSYNAVECYLFKTDSSHAPLVVRITGNTTLASSTQLLSVTQTWASGVWHHVAITWDLDVWALYIDGVWHGANQNPTTTGFTKTPSSGSSNPFTFGAQQYDSTPLRAAFFAGAIDEVYVSSRRALPEEIHAMVRRRQYVAGMEQSGRWDTATYQTVLTKGGGGAFDATGVLEESVFLDGATWKMYYTAFQNNGIGLATGSDGLTFAKYGSNPSVAAPSNESHVFKGSDGVYYAFYCTAYSTTSDLYRATSADGLTWGAGSVVLAHNAQAWMIGCANPYIIEVGSTWYMFLECITGTGPTTYFVGLFTSADKGVTWTGYARNPLSCLQIRSGNYSGPDIIAKNGVYHMQYHVSPQAATPASTIAYATSTDLIHWTVQGAGDPVRWFHDEVFATGNSLQTADPAWLEVNGETRSYYDVSRDAADGTGLEQRIDVARFPGTLEKLVASWPVIAPGQLPRAPVFPGVAWAPGPRSLTWRSPSRSLTPMTPIVVAEPGEYRVVAMRFAQYEEIAWQGDSLKGVPTVTITPATGNSGTVTAISSSFYPATGQATEVRIVLDASSAADGDSYTVKVTCGTTGGSTLAAVGLLQIKAQP